jgi:hypothetical protein
MGRHSNISADTDAIAFTFVGRVLQTTLGFGTNQQMDFYSRSQKRFRLPSLRPKGNGGFFTNSARRLFLKAV